MVQMKMGYSRPGIIIEVIDIPEENAGYREYAKVMWADFGLGLEKRRDLKVVSSLIEENDSEDNKNNKEKA